MNQQTRQWLESQKPDLVDWAETFLADHPIYRQEVYSSQLRNLLNIARSGSPIRVTINFLRYQMGRDQAWKDLESGQELMRILEQELQGRCRQATEGLDREAVLEAEAQITAQFWGFVIREYKYREALDAEKSRREKESS